MSSDSLPAWTVPNDFPLLPAGVIHVWRVALTEPDESAFQLLRSLLTEREREQADRFLQEQHGRRFTCGRGRLRAVLARYLDIPAGLVSFDYANLGKPFLSPAKHNSDIQFNFSNSSDLGLLAVTRGCELGVDLERLRDMSDMTGLANRFFADEESAQLADGSLPTFFRFWTRKEAYLKAVGKGLTFPLRDVLVKSTDPDAAILSIAGDTSAAAVWRLEHLHPAEDYVGALAIERVGDRVELFDWSEY